MAENGSLEIEVKTKISTEGAEQDLEEMLRKAESKMKSANTNLDLSQTQKEIKKVSEGLDSMVDQASASFVKLAGGIASFAAIKDLGQKVLHVRDNFQKLEIAFSTMLGSTEKANKLMTQLTETAAKTPFDLNGIASGAKQLLAYGVSAEEVNSKIVQMGDIASGLSIPLGDLVYLYGTTITQGQMFTQDLRQFQGRGIPIAEELAKVMGVTKDKVSQLVTEGKITSDVFIKAFDNMTAEGSKFGGLMEAQSSTIGGQIANIEDAIDMMFNDIGKSSEGFINTALSGISTLVENYEVVGKTILAMAATYGSYRAALALVAVYEKIQTKLLQEAVLQKQLAAASNITLANSDAMAAARKVVFSEAIKANTRAILKNAAAWLTNPVFWITAVLVGVCVAIYNVATALTAQEKAQKAVNEATEKSNELRDQEKSDAESAIQTIQSETASIYDKAEAYEKLKKVMPELTKHYTQAEIAALDFGKAQKEINTETSEKKYQDLYTQRDAAQADVDRYTNNIKVASSTPNGGGSVMYDTKKLDEAKARVEEYNKLIADADALRQKADEAAAAAATAKGMTLPELIAEINTAESLVESARKAYRANMTDANKKTLDDAESTLKGLTEQYQAATDKAWVSTKEMNEEIKKLTETANKEQLELLKSRTKDKMKLIDMELQQTIAAINKEKAAYQEKYGKNADTSQFSRRIDIAKQGAADQKSEVSRERGRQYEDLTADADKFAQNQEIAALKEKADATQDMNEKLLLQAEIRQRMLNIELDELEIERQRALEDAGDDEVQKDIVNQTYDQKEQQVKATSSATAIKEEADTLQQRQKQYEDFAQRVAEIEEQRVANLKKIDEGLESGNISEETAAQQREFVNTQAEQDTEQASLDSFGTDVEGLGAELTGILQSVMDQGIMEVQAQLPTLKAELAKLQSNKNADPTQLAKAFAKVSAAEKKVNDYTEGLGDTTKDYGKESKTQCKKAAAAMSLVGEAVDIVAENFGEYMDEAGQDAMSVIQTVVSASTTALTAISTTSITAAEGVKTAEKASVILAIISAAIQVTMALVNVFAKYFSEAAQLQEQIDENNERIETSKNRIKDLKHEQNDKTGADYWKNQWEQIAEYNNQMLLAEKNQELYEQKQAASHTDKKEEDAKDAAQEAHESAMDAEETMQDLMDEFYEEMSGTNLKSFSENLADSLVEGMREGTEDMSDIWDSALDDMFSDMLKNQINMQLQKNLAGVFEKVQAAFSGGDTELTDAEINAIKAEYESEKERSQSMLDYYQSLMDELGLTTSDDIEASSGGFESMSQDTADELNGRFTSLQMSGASIDAKMQMQVDGTNSLITQAQGIKDSVTLMVQIATNSLEELRQINTNTALLSETNQRLKQIQMNTEKL